MACKDVAKHFTLAMMVAAIVAPNAAADLVVTAQSGTSYVDGQRFPNDVHVTLPKGASVAFRREPEGTQLIVEGPYSGPLSKYKPTTHCPWWNPFCARSGDLDNEKAGGVRKPY